MTREQETTNTLGGLTTNEVQKRIKQGQTNQVTSMPERTVKDIVKTNFLTPFNALNGILLLLVLIAGRPLNATFAFVILFNTCIGTFQELRAKRQLDKLAVLNKEDAIVLRNGEYLAIPVEEIVLGDAVRFDAGKQITIDGVVLCEQAEVDEALLTGEADAIIKNVGDEVFGGSFVIAGTMLVEATKVGDAVYANKLASEAKNFSMAKSELGTAINNIIKIVSWLIVPVGLALLLTQIFASGSTWQNAIVSAVAGIIGMIPEGLVLLTTIAFMVGAIRLSRRKTLVQDFPAIESLARVDVLCLDKTGTLTEGTLQAKNVLYLNNDIKTNDDIDNALAGLAHYLPAANATQIALKERFTETTLAVLTTIPFSSARKWSGVTFANKETWIIGAPEVLLDATLQGHEEFVTAEQEIGNRVLCLISTTETLDMHNKPHQFQLQAFIVFEDIIRNNATKTLAYFAKQQVEVKIISGDSPITVAAIARKVKLANADKWIDAQTLPEDMNALREIVKNYTIFGRVSPQQKGQLIKALQLNGHTVGMTGDGVNDVLALKQADCSIAMANGSEATRNIAQLVLMDSDFASLPLIVNEGRKVINNIERVASLYLVKTLYSTILSMLFIVLMKPYPFQPIQLSIVSSLMVGIPTFFLALETNVERVTGTFLTNVFRKTVPAALTITLAVITVYIASAFLPFSVTDRSTIAFIVLGGLQFFILYRVARPMKLWKIAMLGLLLVAFISVIFIPQLDAHIGISRLTIGEYALTLIILVAFIVFYEKSKSKIKALFEIYKDKLNFLFKKFLQKQ